MPTYCKEETELDIYVCAYVDVRVRVHVCTYALWVRAVVSPHRGMQVHTFGNETSGQGDAELKGRARVTVLADMEGGGLQNMHTNTCNISLARPLAHSRCLPRTHRAAPRQGEREGGGGGEKKKI